MKDTKTLKQTKKDLDADFKKSEELFYKHLSELIESEIDVKINFIKYLDLLFDGNDKHTKK